MGEVLSVDQAYGLAPGGAAAAPDSSDLFARARALSAYPETAPVSVPPAAVAPSVLSIDEAYAIKPSGAAAVPPGKISGMAANFAARANDTIAGFAGGPVDAAASLFRPTLLDRLPPEQQARLRAEYPGYTAARDVYTGALDNPVGGSDTVRSAMGFVGADPRNVVPADQADVLAGAAGRGAASMLLPWAAARLAAPAMEANTVGRGIAETLGHGGVLSNTAIGATAGATGELARGFVPEPYKPLADFAGNLVGGGLAAAAGAGVRGAAGMAVDLGSRYAAPFGIAGRAQVAGVDSLGREIYATPRQQGLAGQRLLDASSNPGELGARLDAANPELVPGSMPTTGQLTGDMGLLGRERAAATAAPEPFNMRRADQNTARRGALDALAPEGARAEAPGEFFQRQLAEIDAGGNRAVDDARARAQAAAEAAGSTAEAGVRAAEARSATMSDFARTTGEQGIGAAQGALDTAAGRQVRLSGGELDRNEYGSLIRGALDDANRQAKARESALWQQIDPDGTLALNVQTVKAAADRIAREMPAMSRPMSGEEASIIGLARMLPPVQRFSELTALRGRLLGAIREERALNGETPALRRMTQLRQSIDETIGGAADTQASSGQMSLDTTAPRAVSGAPSTGSAVFTPSGRRIDTRYEVVDLAGSGAPVASHTQDLAPNPAYPAELQPRDRSRAASELQVGSIARNLQPERLGASASATEGAPIVGPDNAVESGNARVLGVARAYRQNGPGAAAYREFLRSQGFDTSGMQQPLLIRRRVTPLAPDERVRFAEEANGSPGLAISATERARVDAGRLPDAALELYRGGDIADPANRDFVRAFVQSVPERNEVGSIATADGRLSVEGAQRVRNALLQKAYGDAGLVSALAETGDENIAAFGRALVDAAGDVARLKSDIAAGRIKPEMDPTPALLDAARVVRNARAGGMPLANAVAQQDAFSPLSISAVEILKAGYGDNLAGRVGRGRLNDVLRFYVDEAGKQTTEARLFGGGDVSQQDILSLARSRYGGPTETAGAGFAGNAGRAGSRDGAGRQEASGLGDGAAGPGAPAAGGRGAGILGGEQLTSNFGGDAAARYRAAAAATAERKGTFNAGAPGQVLRTFGNRGDYRLADSQVAGRFFNKGAHSNEDAQAFMRAAGGHEEAVQALQDYAVSELRRYAERTDGTLDAAKAQRWVDDHYDALRVFPDLAARFRDAATTARTVEGDLGAARREMVEAQRRAADLVRAADREGRQGIREADISGRNSVRAATRAGDQEIAAATAAAREARDNYLSTAARHFIGADPVVAVQRALGSRNPTGEFIQLVRMTAGNADARDGLRRAVVDYMRSRFLSNTEAATSGETLIRSDQFQTFVRRNGMALTPLFSPAELESMAAIAADLQRANRSITAARLPGGSNTAQDTHALHGRTGNGTSILQRLIADGFGIGAGMLSGVTGGELVGAVGGEVLTALRNAGIRTVDRLETEALLNPQLARALLQQAGAARRPDRLVTAGLVANLRKLSLAGGLDATGDRRRAAQ